MRPYNVKMVADLLGVSPHTLRAWERRYSAITPERTPKGRRMYAHTEVERLRLLVLLTQQGHHIGSVARLPDTELAKLLQVSQSLIDESSQVLADRRAQVPHSHDEAAERHINYLLAALADYRTGDMAQELEWARLSLTSREVALKIHSPLIARVGELVAQGIFSIAQEHALSSIIRDQVGQILHVLPHHRRPSLLREQNSFLFTTAEGDRHEFGILLGAVLCAYHGLPAHYLGASMPHESLIDAARALHSKIVVLGNTELPEGERKESIEEYIVKLDKGLSSETEIWIGGNSSGLDRALLPFGRTIIFFKSLNEFDHELTLRSRELNRPLIN